jgi:hypothetical protein
MNTLLTLVCTLCHRKWKRCGLDIGPQVHPQSFFVGSACVLGASGQGSAARVNRRLHRLGLLKISYAQMHSPSLLTALGLAVSSALAY